MRLFVSNLRFAMTDRELRDLFSPYGVTNAEIIFNPRTGDSRGFGYVVVEDAKAITDLDGVEYNGRKLHVEPARLERSKADTEWKRHAAR